MLSSFRNAVRAFEVAAAANSSPALQSLAKAVRTRAESVEGRIQHEKQQRMARLAGRRGLVLRAGPLALRTGGYEGHGGWSRSPIGNAALEDAVP